MASFCAQRPSKMFRVLARYLCFLVALSGLVALVHRNEAMPANVGVPLFSSQALFAEQFGCMDYATYVRGAEIIKNKGLRTYAALEYKNFAPGVPYIESVLLSLSPEAPLPFIMLVLTLLTWAWALTELSFAFEGIAALTVPVSLAVTSSIMVAPFFYTALLWDGVLLSESLSTPFFLLGFLSVCRAYFLPEEATPRTACFAAVYFALAAFLRAQFDVLFISMFIAVGAYKLCVILLRRKNILCLGDLSKKFGKTLWLILAIYLAFTVPYRLVVSPPFMVVNKSLWQFIWHDRAYFEQSTNGYFAAGGGHVTCEANPEKCAEFVAREKEGKGPRVNEARRIALWTVFRNPVKYFSLKLPYFYKNWLDDFVACSGGDPCATQTVNKPILFMLPLMFLYIFLGNEKEKRWRCLGLYTFVFVSLTLGVLAFSIFMHVEPRYMLTIKLFVFWSEAFVIGHLLCKAIQRLRGAKEKKSAC